MALAQFTAAQRRTEKWLDANCDSYMLYGPISPLYWSERCRIIAVNMEPYGYEECDPSKLTRDTLIGWLRDAGGTRTRTVRYTMALMHVTRDCVLNGIEPTEDGFRRAYRDEDLLIETLDRTTYYNLRAESNCDIKQDYAAICAVGSSGAGALIWNEIRALEPAVLLISGRAGFQALNGMAKLDPALEFRGAREHEEGFLMRSIAHPSRPSYSDWCDVALDVKRWWHSRANA